MVRILVVSKAERPPAHTGQYGSIADRLFEPLRESKKHHREQGTDRDNPLIMDTCAWGLQLIDMELPEALLAVSS